MFEQQIEVATKAMYAAVGAPVVGVRMAKDYGEKLADRYGKFAETAEKQYDTFATEGEKFAKKLQSGDVVEEIQSRVDLEKVQDRVEKLRDQLEGALQSWRDSFTPAEPKAATKVPVEAAEKATPAKKAATTKTTAKKTTAKAAPKSTARKTTTSKAPAKKTAAKKTTAKAGAAK
jgi:hypothetical protein